MKCEIPLRIIVREPPDGVSMQIQRGRMELLPPSTVSKNSISFDLDVRVDLSSGSPNFLGEFAQGPKAARFIYLNSGTMAGQPDSCWSRRAKISLMSIQSEQVNEVLASPGARLEVTLGGTGRGGGPVCASLKPPPVWEVIAE
jgi:hypothetical protein